MVLKPQGVRKKLQWHSGGRQMKKVVNPLLRAIKTAFKKWHFKKMCSYWTVFSFLCLWHQVAFVLSICITMFVYWYNQLHFFTHISYINFLGFFLTLYLFSLHHSILDLSCLNSIRPGCWSWPFKPWPHNTCLGTYMCIAASKSIIAS